MDRLEILRVLGIFILGMVVGIGNFVAGFKFGKDK